MFRIARVQRAVLIASLPILPFVFAFAACGDDDDTDATGTSQATSPSDEIVGVALPAAAEDYAQALFDAWEAGDQATIDQLADDEPAAALVARPWSADDDWVFDECTASSGSSFCTWNGATEDLVFELNTSETVNSGDAVISVVFGTPGENGGSASIPTDPEQYADAAFDAWMNGDEDGMETLVDSPALPVLQTRQWLPSDGWKKTSCDDSNEGYFCSWEATNGEKLEMRVDEDVAGSGGEQAVTDAIFTGF